jgi:hypothetical protein
MGDGNSDLIVTDNLNEVSVFFGDGAGSFSDGQGNAATPIVYGVGTDPSSVTIADLNGDDRPDIVTTNSGSGDVSVLLQSADHTFATAIFYATCTDPASAPSAVVVADLDGDFNVDLAVTNSNDDEVAVLLGNGDGTFQAAATYSVGSAPDSLAIGNLDSRPSLDVATANFTGHSVAVLLNNTNSYSNTVNTSAAIQATNNAPDVAAPAQYSGSANTAIAMP